MNDKDFPRLQKLYSNQTYDTDGNLIIGIICNKPTNKLVIRDGYHVIDKPITIMSEPDYISHVEQNGKYVIRSIDYNHGIPLIKWMYNNGNFIRLDGELYQKYDEDNEDMRLLLLTSDNYRMYDHELYKRVDY